MTAGGFWPNLWAVLLMAVLLGSKLPGRGPKKPVEAPEPVSEPQHSCDCGCSEQPLHQLTKK